MYAALREWEVADGPPGDWVLRANARRLRDELLAKLRGETC
jgi:hypothetical protein